MKSSIWVVLGLFFVSNIALAQTAKKTITNDDLEKFKQKRLQAEVEYKAKYKELGMPSPEELERQNAESSREREELSQRLKSENQLKQDYWQSRANALRYEIYNVNGQINYLSQQIGSLPSTSQIFFSPSQINAITYLSYGSRHRRSIHPRTVAQVPKSIQTVINASAANPNPFYGTPLYGNGVNPVFGQSSRPDRQRVYPRYYGNYAYTVQYPNYSSLRREELVSRLQYLEQIRAGLSIQWDNLVEEARRAGFRIDF